MRWLSTTVLGALLVGLGTFYYVYEIRQAPEREKVATVKDRLWKELDGKDVEEIVVRRGGVESLHLKRNGDVWSLITPVAATADHTPWALTFQRGGARWRLVTAGPVLP